MKYFQCKNSDDWNVGKKRLGLDSIGSESKVLRGRNVEHLYTIIFMSFRNRGF